MTKKPPEMTWQDKAILIALPLVVFTIFIVANNLNKDVTVADAFEQKLPDVIVRDGGYIIQVYPKTASDTCKCRVIARDKKTKFDFSFVKTGSETINFQVGRLIQFYGKYKYNLNGGVVKSPFKGKSGRMTGWVIYENHRYLPKNINKNHL